ncbi:phage Tail Collar domain protein [Escherichia coli]|nr:phage Tail Collar domain protein [Escherichia coli]
MDDGRKVDTRRSLLSGQAATFIRTALQDYYGYDLNTNVKVGIAFATADSVITVETQLILKQEIIAIMFLHQQITP